jgi:hypothetical protein
MADFKTHKTFKNTNLEVLTHEGFKDFKGLMVGENNIKIILKFSGNKTLTCTEKHKIVLTDGSYVYAKDLEMGDTVYGNFILLDKTKVENNEPVYEFLDVKDNHTYYVNGLLSSQCLVLDELAFLDAGLLENFWKSVYPIISSAKKSKILAASTPNGIGNLFHELWEGAIKKGEEWNGWHGERVDWWEVPSRDEKWKNETIRTLGSREAFMQEFENAFLASGEIPIDKDVYDMLESGCKDPEYIFDDGQYVVWDEPNEKCHYVVGVDVGEGLNQNATVCQILNITDLTNITQDAVYYTKKISPYYFAQKLHDLLQQWGRPPVLIERNGCGAQVIDSLKMNYGYENIVTWGTKGAISNDFKITNKAGIISHQNSKIEAVTNMRYFLNEMRSIKIRDIKTLSEIKDFIRHPNGTWSGRTANTLDDRVMALVWATAIFINDICKRYYEMIAMDDNQRPLKIKPIDYGITDIVSPSNIYVNEKDAQAFMPLPTVFSNPIGTKDEFSNIPDYEILKKDGWDVFTKDFNF